MKAHRASPSHAPHDARGDDDIMIFDRALLSACIPPGKVPKISNGNTAVWINTTCVVCYGRIKCTKKVNVNGACKTAESAEDAVWLNVSHDHSECARSILGGSIAHASGLARPPAHDVRDDEVPPVAAIAPSDPSVRRSSNVPQSFRPPPSMRIAISLQISHSKQVLPAFRRGI